MKTFNLNNAPGIDLGVKIPNIDDFENFLVENPYFSSYVWIDSPFCCDHFDGKVVVEGWPEAGSVEKTHR